MNIPKKHSWRAFVVNPETYNSLQLFAINQGVDLNVVEKCDINSALYRLHETKVNLYIVEYISEGVSEENYHLFTKRAHALGSKVILLWGKSNCPNFNWLKTINIDYVESTPIDIKTFEGKILKLMKNQHSSVKKLKYATILTFIKLKERNGSVTCALNSANLLSKQGETLVIDFDTIFSPTRAHCHLEKNNYLTDLLVSPGRIDRQLILSSVNKISKRLYLLSATNDFNNIIKYNEKAIHKLIDECSIIYKYIVIHLPFSTQVHLHPSLTLSSWIIGIVNLNKANQDLLTRFKPELLTFNNKNRIKFWVNHTEKYSDLSIKECFKNLDIIPVGELNFYPELMEEARDTHKLATLISPSSKFTKELANLLQDMQLYNVNKPKFRFYMDYIRTYFKLLFKKNKEY